MNSLKGVDPNAGTLKSFLMSKTAQEAVRGGVVIMDEASRVSTRDMAQFVAILKRIEARAILVGDIRQHASVAAGARFELLQEYSGHPVVEIDEIVRQQTAPYRAACELFSKHDIRGGLARLEAMGGIHEMQEPYRTEAIVLDFVGEFRDGKDVIVVAPTHAEAKGITAGIRAALREYGR